jgi:hypothetical protein
MLSLSKTIIYEKVILSVKVAFLAGEYGLKAAFYRSKLNQH